MVLIVCLYFNFTTLVNEEEVAEGEAQFHYCTTQDQDTPQGQGKPSWCLLYKTKLIIIYHACFTSEDLQNTASKTIFEVYIII